MSDDSPSLHRLLYDQGLVFHPSLPLGELRERVEAAARSDEALAEALWGVRAVLDGLLGEHNHVLVGYGEGPDPAGGWAEPSP